MAEREFAKGGFVRPVRPRDEWTIQDAIDEYAGGCVNLHQLRLAVDRSIDSAFVWPTNDTDEITAVKDDGGTDSQTRPENVSNPAKSDADGAIRWCADRGYALDEADEAFVRDTWGVR